MQRIVVIGSGNLAESLCLALKEAGAGLIQLYARNRERGALLSELVGVPCVSTPEELAEADLYLVAVSDRAVGEVTRPLPIPPTAVVAHTAGSIAIEALAHHPRHGSFYPFQSFTAGRRIDFSELFIFVEGSDPQTEEVLHHVAEQLSRQVLHATSEQRRRIHLSGVFACNFVNALYGVGADLLQDAELPYAILKPLMMETARKAVEASHPALVQTGPAVRGDQSVLTRHQEELRALGRKEIAEVYNNLSKLIWETSKKTLQK